MSSGAGLSSAASSSAARSNAPVPVGVIMLDRRGLPLAWRPSSGALLPRHLQICWIESGFSRSPSSARVTVRTETYARSARSRTLQPRSWRALARGCSSLFISMNTENCHQTVSSCPASVTTSSRRLRAWLHRGGSGVERVTFSGSGVEAASCLLVESRGTAAGRLGRHRTVDLRCGGRSLVGACEPSDTPCRG